MLHESRRHRLRALTTDAHAEFDASVGGFEAAVDYVRYLKGQYVFRHAIEAGLARVAWPAAFDDWRFRPLAPLLSADLADLGIAPPPVPPAFPVAPPDLLGVLYVLEGSTLGARVLHRRAADIGFDGRFGARHLAAQAEDRDSWPALLAIIEAFEPFEMERTVNAALAAFAAAGAAFERPLDVVA
ncbi:biliverdin-producing heme oxygenase [Ancylobacter defluvii]|uniref:Heme oxygenase n=1 Tax=Ancylobacter defluvii TaxID=1282440 RepID=A0A9W6JSV9_9HYPH|nr:biliverdin-producing heme oxygenase [Ancylobacter defluvii]MBS7587782.1 biliverdin-producing heme oxygenase [Ancylobacter defluvii]GLK82592.1 heme oxygenase [Ancylobacter defluvii]